MGRAKSSDAKRKSILFRLDDELSDRLERLARSRSMGVAGFVRMVLIEQVGRYEHLSPEEELEFDDPYNADGPTLRKIEARRKKEFREAEATAEEAKPKGRKPKKPKKKGGEG